MPVAHLYVVGATSEQIRRLGEEATDIYADALTCPVERVRVYVVNLPAENVTVAGENCADGAAPMPFFTARFRADRPQSQREDVMRRFSRLLAETIGVEVSGVRGQIIPVKPENWKSSSS